MRLFYKLAEWLRRAAVPERVEQKGTKETKEEESQKRILGSEDWPRLGWIGVALAVMTLAIFSPLFHYDFLTFDDQAYVTENSYVRSGLNANSVAWAFQTRTAGNWHPLTWLSHMLDVEIYGVKAGGHHLTNVLWHTANVVLLLLVLYQLTGTVWRSALVAALFAWHPAHVESVAWIAERKDVLSAFFGLLTVSAYASYVKKGGKGKYVLAVALFALALLAKPMLVTLPCLLLLLDFWPLRRGAVFLVEKIPFFVLGAACCGWTLWAQEHSQAVSSVAEISIGHRLGHVLVSYLDYLGLLVFPHDLAIFYPYPLHERAALVVAGALVVVVISVLAGVAARKRPWLVVGWLWFLGMLVPVIGVVQAGGQAMADRYTYLPSIGLFIMVVWGGAELATRYPAVKVLVPLVGIALLAGTWRQIHYWQNTRTIFEHAAQVTSRNYLASTLLGELHGNEGDQQGALKLFHEALFYNPKYSPAHFFLGRALDQQGQTEQALQEYRWALQLNPAFEQAHILLGLLLAKEHKDEEAAAEYEAVLKLNPRSAVAHNDLARLRQEEGRLDESIEHYTAALQYDASLAQAHNNLGVLYLQKGQLAEGTAQLQEAARLEPDNAETKYNLAMALNQQQRWTESLELWPKIASSQPSNARAQYQYGMALAGTGKTRNAMSQFAKALLLTPDFPEALNELAWIAATDPHPELRNGTEAVAMAQRACELTQQKQPAMLLTLAAAYAETGRFEEAVALSGKVAAASPEWREKAKRMLTAFAAKKTWRD